MENYRRLKVSSKARDFAVLVYQVTSKFPRAEQFGMTSQMRDAATSIGLNIAEGCGRGTTPDKIRFFTYSNGSAQEAEFAAELSIDLRLAPEQDLRRIMIAAVELRKMLRALV